VVITHGFNGFYVADNSFDRPYYFLTYPIIRLILQGGYFAVAIFFVMSGYVCSIKPLKLARAGNAEASRKVITSSAFRRLLRLGAPAIVATTMSWFLDRLGAFCTARSLPGYCWFSFFTSEEVPSFWESVRLLFRSFVPIPSKSVLISSFVHGIMMVSIGRHNGIIMRVYNGLWHMKFVDPC
jgi:peptidoglycan/LPS O-acetylase OafA/YrhL